MLHINGGFSANPPCPAPSRRSQTRDLDLPNPLLGGEGWRSYSWSWWRTYILVEVTRQDIWMWGLCVGRSGGSDGGTGPCTGHRRRRRARSAGTDDGGTRRPTDAASAGAVAPNRGTPSPALWPTPKYNSEGTNTPQEASTSPGGGAVLCCGGAGACPDRPHRDLYSKSWLGQPRKVP